MKSAALLTAILSGLCAEAMAAPISDIRTVPPALEDTVIEPDLGFNFALLDEALRDEDQSEIVTTGIVVDEEIDEREFTVNVNEPSGSLRVPEPPPLTTIAVGLGSLGFLALYRQSRRERRRAARRTIQYRAIITAER
jgi:hypothetical protein